MDRNQIDNKYKWDLSKIYSSEADFRKDIEFVLSKLEEFDGYKDFIQDANTLYELLTLYMNVSRILSKLEVYVSLLVDEDTSINKNRELKEEIVNLYSKFASSTYFVDTNILNIGYNKIEEFYSEKEELKEYSRYLSSLYRYKNYTLSVNQEKLLADMSLAFGNNYETYELLKDSDMVFEDFYVNSKKYELDNNKYSLYIEDNDRLVRKGAFFGLYNTYRQYKNVFANLIISNMKEEVSLAHVRGYNSSMEASLYKDEIDISIYNNLINVVNENMSVIYNYYNLKKEVLGLDELHLYDVYVNLIDMDSKDYSFDNAKDIVVLALSVFGDEYTNVLKEGISNRWIDVYPNKSKRTGGYSSGSYDTFPYILLNYQNKYDDMSTLAHELGHSMHSYFTRSNNTYQDGSYSIFVAEVASLVNELLLAKYILKNSNDKNEKMFILNRLMELFRSTIFRQTMFSEFERDAYNLIEEDKPVTADILSYMYYKLNKKYFGEDVYIDEEIQYEWERIPHFYYNFYVYKYATGLSAACYIVSLLLDSKLDKEKYLEFLKCGRSKSPLDSLKITGVDLSRPEVIRSAIEMFNDIILEFRELYFS